MPAFWEYSILAIIPPISLSFSSALREMCQGQQFHLYGLGVCQDMAVCRVRCSSLLLRWLGGLVFTCRRHYPLQSQIGHHVPIVLIRVRCIDREQRQLGYVEVEEFHHL